MNYLESDRYRQICDAEREALFSVYLSLFSVGFSIFALIFAIMDKS